jgi:hypothetical protein
VQLGINHTQLKLAAQATFQMLMLSINIDPDIRRRGVAGRTISWD